MRSGNETIFVVIWEIILRDFWGNILRGPQLESRIILLGRPRLDTSSRHIVEAKTERDSPTSVYKQAQGTGRKGIKVQAGSALPARLSR